MPLARKLGIASSQAVPLFGRALSSCRIVEPLFAWLC